MNTFESARSFVYRNARPLDLALWQYHFENHDKENILKVLSFYQNDDGGFGNGLELDFLNPLSSPISTWKATEILREIDFNDKSHPIIKGILKYLDSNADFSTEHNQWMNTVPSNNDYPHAIWWTYKENEVEYRYNPTASLVGFILKFSDKDSALYKKGCVIAQEAVEWFVKNVPFEEQHITACFITLYDCLSQENTDICDMTVFREKLRRQVSYNICDDKTVWAEKYVPKPSNFIMSRDSIFYQDNKEICDYECEFISESQLDDGSVNVTWQWRNEFIKEFAVSENFWKSNLTLNNMRYLKAFDQI